MVTALVIVGRAEAGEMVFTSSPGAGPSGMLKLMVSVVGRPLETLIASRRVHSVELQPPVPGSAVELTVKVTAWAGFASIRTNSKAAIIAATKARTLAFPATRT